MKIEILFVILAIILFILNRINYNLSVILGVFAVGFISGILYLVGG